MAQEWLSIKFPVMTSYMEPRMLTEELISPGELAKRLGVSRQTLSIWRLRGGDATPRYIKLGSRVAYDAADVQAWLASRKRGSTSESADSGGE
jgi:predicted DNA-binding transcriptional regulator AlpA